MDTCNEFDDAIDIRIQKTAMDAKSLLGMLLMKTEEPLEIEYACYDDEDNYEEFKQAILEKYDAKVVPASENLLKIKLFEKLKILLTFSPAAVKIHTVAGENL